MHADRMDSKVSPASFQSASERPLQLSGQASPQQLPQTLATTHNGAPDNPSAAGGGGTSATGQHPASYMEVLAMLERGETPPGIRVRPHRTKHAPCPE